MRTQPINIYLAEPYEVLEDLTIVIPDAQYMSYFQDGIYVNGKFLILSNDMSVMQRNMEKLVTNGKNVVLTTKNWNKALEFLTMFRDYLEEHDGIETLYVIPTRAAVQVFGEVALNYIAEPEFANGYVPSNDDEKPCDDLLHISDLFNEDDGYRIFDDEVAATVEQYLDVDSNGYIMTAGGCVGNLCEVPVLYGTPNGDVTKPAIYIHYDTGYVPGATYNGEEITPSGHFNKEQSIFTNLKGISTGDFSLLRQSYNGLRYLVFKGDEPVFVHNVDGHMEYHRGSIVGEVVGQANPTLINTELGLLFARCAARDKRYKFAMNAGLHFNGLEIPVVWKETPKGGELKIGSCVINETNWKLFMEV